MEPWIRSWDDWMGARGDFYDYRDKDGLGRVQHDVSIIQDTAAEKAQDMAEVGVTMHPWEYRQKWYGEDEKTAKARARGLGVVSKGQMPSD
jgi:hypothetical protein